MLVLSRQRDETIIIGDNIEITVVDIRGEKVRLGINAPPHIPVHRKEVYEAIKREKAGEAKPGEESHVESLAMRRKHPENHASPAVPHAEPNKPQQPDASGTTQKQ
jgi:carbon storage regulator